MNTIQLPLRKLIFGFALLVLILAFGGCSDDACNLSGCENGGILSIDCECVCPEGFTGTQCETSTCILACENGGSVNSDCECNCPDGFTGTNCEECVGKCGAFEQGDYVISNSGGWQANDYEIDLPNGYVLTGLGFNSSATLVLKGRELLENCTLGEEFEFRDGPNPSGSVAVSYTVPAGHVVTGVGWGESQNNYRLVVNYNELLMDDDCDLYLGPELLYDNNVSTTNVDVWLKISDGSFDTKASFFGGLGIKFSGSLDRQVETQVREIINQF